MNVHQVGCKCPHFVLNSVFEIGKAAASPRQNDVLVQTRMCGWITLGYRVGNSLGDAHLHYTNIAGVEQKFGNGEPFVVEDDALLPFVYVGDWQDWSDKAPSERG